MLFIEASLEQCFNLLLLQKAFIDCLTQSMSISSVCTVVACMYLQLPAFLLCSSPQPFLSSGLCHTFQSLFIPKPLINTLPGSLPADLQVFRQRRCEQNLSLAASFFSYCLFIVQPSAPFNIYLPSSLQYFVFVSCSWFFCHLSPPIITDTCSVFSLFLIK